MSLTMQSKDVYEDFDPKKDSLFFKIGSRGQISFHGQNYHIRRRLTPEQKHRLMTDFNFIKIDGNCYVNVQKIRGIAQNCIDFGPTLTVNRIPVNRKIKAQLKQRLTQ